MRLGKVAGISTLLVVGALIGGIAGILAYKAELHHKLLPGSLRAKLHVEPPTQTDESPIRTIFTALGVTSVPIPPSDRDGRGGAITPLGDDILLMDFDGRLFVVNRDKQVRQLGLNVPDNGYEAYRAYAETDVGRTFNHTFYTFRYNDIEFVETESGGRLILSYTHFDGDRACFDATIATLDVTRAEIDAGLDSAEAPWREIFSSRPCLPLKPGVRSLEGQLGGGRFVYHPDGYILLANGDYGWDGTYGPMDRLLSQEPESEYGKLIRIDLPDGGATIHSLGYRNTQGIARDDAGRIWIVEHGMRGGDELNLARPGANYGWPLVSLGTSYSALPMEPTLPEELGRHPRFQRPEIAFLPSIATSSLAVSKGFFDPWEGDLLIGTLAAQSLVRVRYVEDRVLFTEFIDVKRRIRDVLNTPQGELVLWADTREVLFLTPAAGGPGRDFINRQIDELPQTNGLQSEVRLQAEVCSECHSYNRGASEHAPSLADVFERQIGKSDFQGYTEALRTDGRRWTRKNLRAYLHDPEGFIHGTSMPRPEMSDAALDAFVDVLIAMSTELEFKPEAK